MKTGDTELHEQQTVLDALCTVLPQLDGNRAKGEYILNEIARHPWLAKYLRGTYDPRRQYDGIIRGQIPHTLINKIFERADLPPVPVPTEPVMPAGDLCIEITATPPAQSPSNAAPATINIGEGRVGTIVFYLGKPMKQALTLLRRLGVTVIFPKHLR